MFSDISLIVLKSVNEDILLDKSSISEDEYYTDADEILDLGNDLFNFPDRQSTSNSSVYMSVANYSPNDQNYDHGLKTHNVNHRDEIILDFLFPGMIIKLTYSV